MSNPTYVGLIENSSNITLRDIRAISENTWSEDAKTYNGIGFGNGIYFSGSSNITVDGLYFKGTRSGKGVEFDNCKNSIIKNSKISHTARAGISVTGYSNNIHVVDNTVEYATLRIHQPDGAIDIYGEGYNTIIERNYVNKYGNDLTYIDSEGKEITPNGCGIRMKSGTNNKAINNVINVSNKRSIAGIFVQPRTRDKDGDGKEEAGEPIHNISLIGNRIHVEQNGSTQWYIRVATSLLPINGVVISENIFSTDDTKYTASETISIRSKMKNVVISKNKFFIDSENLDSSYVTKEGEISYSWIMHISLPNDTGNNPQPVPRDNVLITENILMHGSLVANQIEDGIISNNIITYFTPKNAAQRCPIAIGNSHNTLIYGNILKTNLRKDGNATGIHQQDTTSSLQIDNNIEIKLEQ